MTEYIENQIHYPENKYNLYHFTEDELRTSIEEMRKFIQAQYSKPELFKFRHGWAKICN